MIIPSKKSICSIWPIDGSPIGTTTPAQGGAGRKFHSHHHHHHVVPLPLSFIALGRSSGQHPVSSHSCWMYVRAGRPAFARPCVGVHKEYISYEFVPASPAVSCMSGSSNLNSFRDRRQVAVQLVSCGVLSPGLVQDCSQHSCVIAV